MSSVSRETSFEHCWVEIVPFGVLLFNQPHLPIASPFLQLLLASDRPLGSSYTSNHTSRLTL
jgi:hypothetical protein